MLPLGATAFPDRVAAGLVRGMPGNIVSCKVRIRPGSDSVALEITGHVQGIKSFWFSAQEVNFGDSAVWKNLTDIPRPLQRRGLSKVLMHNTFQMAVGLGLQSIRLHAVDVGSYAWLRYGFVPSDDDWNGDMKAAIIARLAHLKLDGHVSSTTMNRLLKLLSGTDARLAAAIAVERVPVPSLKPDVKGRDRMVPLGWALIGEANEGKGASWRGSLNLLEPDDTEGFLIYVKGHMERRE